MLSSRKVRLTQEDVFFLFHLMNSRPPKKYHSTKTWEVFYKPTKLYPWDITIELSGRGWYKVTGKVDDVDRFVNAIGMSRRKV